MGGITQITAENIGDILRDKDIIVYENITGNKIYFSFSDGLMVKPKSIANSIITDISRAVNRYYDPIFDYLQGLDSRIKDLCGDMWFCCEYITESDSRGYTVIPDNNLVLTSIVKEGKHTFSPTEIREYSALLGISALPLIFYGKLSQKQIEVIRYFLTTSEKDLEYVFGERNFAYFIYKMLNPSSVSSAFMKDNEYKDMLDKLIIKNTDNTTFSFSILNPLYKKNEKTSTYSSDYQVLVIDFLEFIQRYDISRKFISGDRSDTMYIDIICDLFNKYMEEREAKVKNFDFDIPQFFMQDKNKVNLNIITDPDTVAYVSKDKKFEYFLQVIINSFMKKRFKETELFTASLNKLFNQTVDYIETAIDRSLNIGREDMLRQTDLLDFSDYFSIKHPDTDAAGEFYISKQNTVDKSLDFSKKKKKFGK